MGRDEITDDLVRDEFMAQCCEALFEDEAGIRDFAAKHKNTAQKIVEWLENVLEKISGINMGHSESDIAAVISQWQDGIEELREKWLLALEDAANNKNASEGVLQSSANTEVKDETRKSRGKRDSAEEIFAREDADKMAYEEFARNVDLVLNRQYQPSKGDIVIGRTPSVLTDIGLNELPLTISAKHIYTIARTEAEALKDYGGKLPSGLKDANFHGLGKAAVLDIYNQISNPVMVLQHQEFTSEQQKSHAGSHKITVVVEFNVDGKQVIAPIEVDAVSLHDSKKIDTNRISTYFDKNNFSAILKEAIAKENIGETGFYYINKNRAVDIFTRERHQLPNSLKMDSSNIIIRNIDEKVNRKIASILTSRQFLRWFGDWTKGKVDPLLLNEDGTPRVFYHQTNARFTEFNTKNQREGRLDTDTPTGLSFLSYLSFSGSWGVR